nr:reverse transcriptase domain-containing protein [Tanacetum cinerariifolium]
MTNGREMTPPPGFSTPPHIPNDNTNERPHVTTNVFAATTLGNTSFTYRASTSTDPTPMIRFEEGPNKEGSRIGRNIKGNRPLEAGGEENERWEMDLPLLLAAHLGRNKNGQPLQQKRFTKTYLVVHSIKQREGESVRAFATRLSKTWRSLKHPKNSSILPKPDRFEEGSNKEGSRIGRNIKGNRSLEAGGEIEDYPLSDGLKMPSHVDSYDGNEDPYNFLHLFEGAIHMQKWLIPMACHMFTYTLKDSA